MKEERNRPKNQGKGSLGKVLVVGGPLLGGHWSNDHTAGLLGAAGDIWPLGPCLLPVSHSHPERGAHVLGGLGPDGNNPRAVWGAASARLLLVWPRVGLAGAATLHPVPLRCDQAGSVLCSIHAHMGPGPRTTQPA